MTTSVRETYLAEASKLTGGDRNAAYGPPHQNLTHMATMVTAYLIGKYNLGSFFLDSEDMAWIMVMAKMSRTVATAKADNYIDAAAYAAIAGECRDTIETELAAEDASIDAAAAKYRAILESHLTAD
jgi:hypothetical protein